MQPSDLNIYKIATYEVKIWIAGDLHTITHQLRLLTREFPSCVTVTPTKFVYNNGAEDGAVIGLSSYPKFPDQTTKEIDVLAVWFAKKLIVECCQTSALVVTPTETQWITTQKPVE